MPVIFYSYYIRYSHCIFYSYYHILFFSNTKYSIDKVSFNIEPSLSTISVLEMYVFFIFDKSPLLIGQKNALLALPGSDITNLNSSIGSLFVTLIFLKNILNISSVLV